MKRNYRNASNNTKSKTGSQITITITTKDY